MCLVFQCLVVFLKANPKLLLHLQVPERGEVSSISPGQRSLQLRRQIPEHVLRQDAQGTQGGCQTKEVFLSHFQKR